MTGRRLVIVGSYPPIPRPAAAVTVGEVRRAWDAGDEVTVVSPRLSAAHLAVPVFGLLAGRRLDNVRRVTGARRVVLLVEDGFPLPGRHPLYQRAAGEVLARALSRFDHVRLVRVGAVHLPPEVHARLASVAQEVADAPAGPAPTGVTPLGPPELRLVDRPAHVASIVARRLLGPRAADVRAWLGRLRR